MNLKLSLAVTQLGFGLSHAGYCNWGNDGTGASSTCNGINQGGSWCNVGQANCEEGCQGRWCTNDGNPTPPTQPPTPPSPPLTPPPVGSNSGIATTTRYWDCSGGACGCAYVPSGFGESEPVHCHSNAMFEAPEGNSYGAKFYGTAAISEALGGGNWMSEGCGKCWRVTGTSNAGSIAPGVQTTLVLKGTNFCPPGNAPCENGKAHFDIAAPGFDVTAFSLSNTCSTREPDEAEGFEACGNWMIGSQDPEINCDCTLFNDQTLRQGCENFYSLYWDNSPVNYEEVPCPQELSSLHCAHPYAFEDVDGIPESCSSNDYLTEPSPITANPTEEPTPEPTPPPVGPETTTSSTSSTTTTSKVTSTTPETTEVTTTASSSSCNGCSWDNGANCPDAWCNQSFSNCVNFCSGTFFGSDGPSPSTPKPTLRPVIPPTPPTDTSKCGCSSCTASILSRDASGYSVISRIDWAVANMAKTDIEACNLVCGDEFPTICGECDPSSCNDEGPSPTPPSPTPPTSSTGDGTPGFTTTWTSDPNTIQGGACEYATPSATAQGDSWLSPFVKSGNYCGVTLDLFEGGAACGRCYLVSYDGSSATDPGRPGEQIVQIVETGTAGGYTNLFDCFIDAKERITGSPSGIFPITYSQVDCPNPASPAAVILDGNNAWYVKVLLAGGLSGIVSATLRIGESTFPLSRVAGATFSASTNNAQGPASFDVTYDNGSTATIDGCFGGAWPVETSSVCD